MKIRNGFVSNSSSTSFLVVGVANYQDPRLAKLAELDEWKEGWGGYNEGNTFVFLGNEYDYDENDTPKDYQPHTVGIEAEKALKEGRTVAELRKEFVGKAKELGVTFRESEVDLHFGEVSSE
jgi:hypothetical protein